MLKKVFTAFRKMQQARIMKKELLSMTDKELKDIGVSVHMIDDLVQEAVYGRSK